MAYPTLELVGVFARRGRLILALAAGVSLGSVAEGAPPRAHALSAVDPQHVARLLGHCALDGTLSFETDLCVPSLYRDLGIRCALRHELAVTAGGAARTRWHFDGLQTWLVSSGRDALQWQPLSGPPVAIPRSKVVAAFGPAKPGQLVVRQIGDFDFEVRTPRGAIFRYTRGRLSAIVAGSRTFRVAAAGGWIERITADAAEVPVFTVRYDAEHRPLELSVDGAPAVSFHWEAGELREWERAGEPPYAYAYNDGLLSAVRYSTHAAWPVAWEDNAGWRAHDPRWRAPVHLARFGDTRYTFSLEERGWVIGIESAAKHEHTVVCFNPRTRQLTAGGTQLTLATTLR